MYQYWQPKQDPSSKTGLQTTAVFMIVIVVLCTVLLLFKVGFSLSPLAFSPISPKAYPLVVYSNYEKVRASAYQNQRPILIFLRTDYCYPCDLMKAALFENTELKNFVNDHFIIYEFDEFVNQHDRELADQILLNNRLPALLLCYPNGKIFGQISDIFEPNLIQEQLMNLLKTATGQTIPVQTAGASNSIDFNPEYETLYGLEVDLTYDYFAARQLAIEYAYIWDKGVWIQQEPPGHYRIILGAFDAEYKASMTRKLLYSWEGIQAKIVELKMDGELY